MNPISTPLPSLFFITDPERTPHPEDVAAHLPTGCGIIYRHFGDSHAPQRARLLKRLSLERGLTLLIGEDLALALEVGADGLHLREASLGLAPDLHARHPHLHLTAACHSLDSLRHLGDDSGLSAVFVSPIFQSRSASAQGVGAIGVKGIRRFTEISALPVYGLGGITCDTIASLRDCGLSGIGAVDAFNLID